MAFGPAEGLAIVEPLREDAAMARYRLLPAVRGDFLFKLGRYAEARDEFASAAGLAKNTRERNLMDARARECDERGQIRRSQRGGRARGRQ